MKAILRFLCVLTAAIMLTCSAVPAEVLLYDPVTIVQYDQTMLGDWSPCYGLSAPGVLLELAHSEGMLSVTAIQKGDLSSEEYLSDRLDLAAETLAISNAQLLPWKDPFKGDGNLLNFSYTYPDGDEIHLCRIRTASFHDMLIELSIDTWGEEAEQLMNAAENVLNEGGFTIDRFERAAELTATLTDVTANEDDRTLIQLTGTQSGAAQSASYYPVASHAVILFPHPDNPFLFCPVAPDMASLVDAILTYEESSDSPAVFRSILQNDMIVYMEYSLPQQ